jgi:hypothetical protein
MARQGETSIKQRNEDDDKNPAQMPEIHQKPVWHKSEADDSGHGRVASEAANTVLGSSLVCHACVTTLQASKLDEQ